VLIGIEDNKPEAVAAMQAAVLRLGEDHEVVAVPTRYPAGGAKQLIRVLTGKEVPASKRSTELGVQCFNVATAYTAYRALAHGEPVISRIVTLTGNVEQPRNWEVRLGTPLSDLVRARPAESRHPQLPDGRADDGLRDPRPRCAGGQGHQLHHRRFADPVSDSPPEMPCIRCGACAEVCPHELQAFRVVLVRARQELRQDAGISPLRLYRMWLLQLRLPVAHSAGAVLSFCQERNLVARARKTGRRRRQGPLRTAQCARRAGTGREGRAPGQGRRCQAAEKKPASAAPASADAGREVSQRPLPAERRRLRPPVDADAVKKATIVAAMERARAQREAVQPRNTEQLTAQQQREIAAIEAAGAPGLQAEPRDRPVTRTGAGRRMMTSRRRPICSGERTSVRRVMLQVLARPVAGHCRLRLADRPSIVLQLRFATLAALAGEALMLWLRGKPLGLFLSDGSAVVTAWLIALAFPPLAPWWLIVVGTLFAIVVAKHLYGGLGQNPFNPAMIAFAVCIVSFPALMSQWPALGLKLTLAEQFRSDCRSGAADRRDERSDSARRDSRRP
jgi:ferredoxin